MNSFQQTVGIELEFAIVYKADAFANIPDLTPSRPLANVPADQAIQHFLKQAGVASNLARETPEDAPYQDWTVDHDCLEFTPAEEASIPEGWTREHIELQSRVFSYVRDDWAAEIQRVTEVLSMMRSDYHCAILTNRTSGFHVHIGNGPDFIPFKTGKRIAQLFTAYESRFDQMHAATRVLAPGLDIEPFRCEPLVPFWFAPPSFYHWNHNADFHILPIDNRIHHSDNENVFNWIQRIEKATDYQGLADLSIVNSVCGDKLGHHAALNFDNCYEDGFYGDTFVKKTIEFRQHIGTVDFQSIVSWILFLSYAVQFCHTADDADFVYLLTKTTDVTFTLADVLAAIGCDDHLIEHLQRQDESQELTQRRHSDSDAAFIDEPMVAELVANNDEEQSDAYQWSTIVKRCGTKFDSGYYGLDPTAAALPFELADVQYLLGLARAKAELQCGPDDDTAAPLARASAFKLLANIYARLDNSLDPRSAVHREFDAWVSEN
ncbi:hypothetical protein CKM354_000275500 [Cercospora kikuchii]|uniref:Amidoligase enzyme n=1 Tax=Cercospora kikuchii TaxID=84275 RepID=A0A9P3C887_9PEZI|nr:uncharacterized protein CKM354_000275500 [Cercospora kikuchii]GIZ39369.1 hypothetical protein CKM354_000275500 [Cercospora kikuchii]